MVRALVFLCLFAVAGSGCGSSKHPVSDCDDFVSVYCQDVYACGANYTSVSECISYVEGALDCGSVVGENPGLGACENDLDTLSCYYLVDSSGYGTIPSSCNNIFIK